MNADELRRIEAQISRSSSRTRESIQQVVAAGDTPLHGAPALVVHADRAALALREAADALDRTASDRAALERVRRLWREYQGAERDILNGRPADDALDEQSDIRAALDAALHDEQDGGGA